MLETLELNIIAISTHQIVLTNSEVGLDGKPLSGTKVTQVVMKAFGYSPGLACKIIREVEKYGKAPCFTGVHAACEKSAGLLRSLQIPCIVKPI